MTDISDRFQFAAGATTVSARWAPAMSPAVAAAAVAHGAGAGMDHPFLAGAAAGLAEAGIAVLRFNFPYMEARRRMPDPAPVLLDTWKEAISQLARRGAPLPMVAGGKSMGGRVASMLAAAQGPDFRGAALVFFGYPLHPPGRVDRLRDSHLSDIRVPMVFLQGTRDALARLDLIEGVVRRLRPLARLHVVPDADHSFRTPGAKRSDREIGSELGEIAARYLRDVLVPGAP
ncbi:MAG TPA: alpha/beta family hydrolase [bacterium]|nr:alpha/beta family hydrolase [bacterium]